MKWEYVVIAILLWMLLKQQRGGQINNEEGWDIQRDASGRIQGLTVHRNVRQS